MIREEVKELENIKLILENSEWIGKIAVILPNILRKNWKRFKALVACASRKASVFHKRGLDKLLLKEYSKVVMTFNRCRCS